ncbi:hypothetical protein [Myxosarcina sp. GI1]|uniref:hypothetical protein n=1 Tax=Myxosarcina sp. GI1 TaxID=1541065 RepID=UPI0012E0BC99|nr:hypothetical protein [Myxosarcina sp. GI1]
MAIAVAQQVGDSASRRHRSNSWWKASFRAASRDVVVVEIVFGVNLMRLSVISNQ